MENIDLTVVSGGDQKNINLDVNFKACSFSKDKIMAKFLYEVGQMLGAKGNKFKIAYNKRKSLKSLIDAKLKNFDIAYVDYATTGILIVDYLKQREIPLVLHVHGYDVTASCKTVEYLNHLKELLKYARYVVSPSYHVKRLLILIGCNEDKIKVIYPFEMPMIEMNVFNKRYKKSPIITFLGRLTPKKNPVALLHAFAIVYNKNPNVILNVMGDGPLMKDCLDKVKELGIENNVIFFGVVDRKLAFEVLSNSWVYAQHSTTSVFGDQEGFPISLAEAAAHALPLVSTIHSGITENIIDGINGFLVQENDYLTMAEKLIYLIENPKEAEQMGKAAFEHISNLCPANSRVKKIIKLLA